MAITMARLGGSSEFLNYILDVMWQRLLHMLHDVSSSLPCLLAMISVAHHCDREIPGWVPLNLSHGAHMQYILSQCCM